MKACCNILITVYKNNQKDRHEKYKNLKQTNHKLSSRTLVLALIGAIIILVVLFALSCYKFHWLKSHYYNNSPQNSSIDRNAVNLGALQYRIENNRAVKRDDMSVKEIRSFLIEEGKKSGCPNNNAVHSVIAANDDETQLLLSYGCGSDGGLMFAAKQDGQWKAISSTNQFNIFSIPSCKMIEDNGISSEIAPVCQNESHDDSGAFHYIYSLR